MWVVIAVALIFAASGFDIVHGAKVPGATERAFRGFAAGLFLGPIGLIIAFMIRAELKAAARNAR